MIPWNPEPQWGEDDGPAVPAPRWVIWLAAIVYVAVIAWAVADRGWPDPFAGEFWIYEIPADVDRSRLVTERPAWW